LYLKESQPSNIQCNSEKYDNAFQECLSNYIDRSKMTSMIYGASRNKQRGIEYT